MTQGSDGFWPDPGYSSCTLPVSLIDIPQAWECAARDLNGWNGWTPLNTRESVSEISLDGNFVVVVQSLSHVQLFVTLWTAAHQASLSFTICQSLLTFMLIESVMLFNHLILCHPFLVLPSVFPNIRVFSEKLALCIRWPKYWSFCFSISPSNKYSEMISFRIDWFDLLVIQRILKSLL